MKIENLNNGFQISTNCNWDFSSKCFVVSMSLKLKTS